MKFIAHRGNIAGKIVDRENTISYIEEALALGYDVEIDVIMGTDGILYLGHDVQQQPITRSFLIDSRKWVHCKNVEAFFELSKFKDINCFFQDQDLLTKTTGGYFWMHSNLCIQREDSVIVRLDYDHSLSTSLTSYGICSDFVEEYKNTHRLKPLTNKPFDLLILDIDGVMTDGTKSYDTGGNVLSKNYCDLDFTAIKRFTNAGIKVCFLSGDTNINEKMAEVRKVDFFFARNPTTGNIDKADFIGQFESKYGIPRNRMAYVGDDYYDLTIIESLSHTYCPSTACTDIKQRVKKVLNTKGGHGVVAELFELIKPALDFTNFPVDSFNVNN